jgi:signal transduction histidine kinase
VEVRAYPDCGTLSVKNISREALNVPPEALLERFVRGDDARTTEGSGLGLSIAQSLTQLQGGTFGVEIDGDLFKATVRLPLAGTPE